MKKPKGVYLSKDELKAVLAVAIQHSKLHWIMMLTAFYHGYRASEVVGGMRQDGDKVFYQPGISGSDISNGYIHVRRAKGSEDNIQPLWKNADPLLSEREYLEELAASNTGELFKMSRKHYWELVQKYAELAGLPEHKRHPHMFKHTLGKQMTLGGAKIQDTQKVLGHVNINSTAVYTRSNDDEAAQAMAAAVGL